MNTPPPPTHTHTHTRNNAIKALAGLTKTLEVEGRPSFYLVGVKSLRTQELLINYYNEKLLWLFTVANPSKSGGKIPQRDYTCNITFTWQ